MEALARKLAEPRFNFRSIANKQCDFASNSFYGIRFLFCKWAWGAHRSVVLYFQCALESLGGLVKSEIAGPHPRILFNRSQVGPQIYISSKFPGDSAALGTPL